jgi:hypothetical protein
VKAPSVAQYLVQEILNHSRDDSQPEVQGSKERGSGSDSKRSSRRRKQSDRTYRLPKSSRTQPDIPRDEAEDPHGASSGSSLVGDDLVTCQPSHDDMTINQSNDSLVTEKLLRECEGDIPEIIAEEVPQERVQGQSSANDRSMPSMGSESALHQLKATYSSDSAKRNSVHGQPSATLGNSTEDGQTVRPPSPSGTEQRETALPEIDGIDGKASDKQATLAPSLPHGTEPQETTLLGLTFGPRDLSQGILSQGLLNQGILCQGNLDPKFLSAPGHVSFRTICRALLFIHLIKRFLFRVYRRTMISSAIILGMSPSHSRRGSSVMRLSLLMSS